MVAAAATVGVTTHRQVLMRPSPAAGVAQGGTIDQSPAKQHAGVEGARRRAVGAVFEGQLAADAGAGGREEGIGLAGGPAEQGGGQGGGVGSTEIAF
jgi:hypothetical protein